MPGSASKPEGDKGEPSTWEAGDYQIDAKVVVVCAGAVNSPALLLRSGFGRSLPRLGHGFTVILHSSWSPSTASRSQTSSDIRRASTWTSSRKAITSCLETCMYFPFTTAKAMAGFGEEHSRFMRAFPRLQMILVLACDEVNAHNRVTVDGDGRPVVHYRFTPEVIHGLVHGAITSAKIFFRRRGRAGARAGLALSDG